MDLVDIEKYLHEFYILRVVLKKNGTYICIDKYLHEFYILYAV